MRNIRGKVAKLMAGCLATVMTVGGGITAPFSGIDTVEAAGAKSVTINEDNFPDPNFRAVISGRDYDRDGNGILSAREIGLTLNIYCEGMDIKSLDGVEYFTNLQGLWCKDNQIETMDISHNKDLRGLWCSGNKFTSLDLSANKELVWVYCYDCNISSLNVKNNPKMEFIECNTNPIKTLDVTHNPELTHLTCGSCELTKLDLSKNPKLAHLDAFRNKLKKLDVTNNPKMKRLDIWDNPGLGSINISNNPGLQYYNCAHNDVSMIDVSNNPELTKLICSYNHIKKMDISKNSKLVYLDCAVNSISSLDLKNNQKLRFLQAFTNDFKTLNIGNNPFLIKTYKEGVKKNEYAVCKGHSWTIDYGGDTSTGGDNILFLCFDDKVTLKSKSTGTVSVEEKYSDLDSGVSEKDLVKREQLVKTLYEMAGSPSVKGLKSRFTDVKSGSSYEKALLWGEKNAICVGYPDITYNTFGVGKWLTRQDLVFMLMRYSEVKGYKRAIDFGRSDDYIDYYDIDFDHWEAVCWSATWNILEGKGKVGAPKEEQKFDPYGRVTKTELKATVKRLLEVNGISGTSTGDKPKKDDSNTGKNYISTEKVKEKQLKTNLFIADKKTGSKFKIIKVNKKNGKVVGGNVSYMASYNKKCTKATVPGTVKIAGVRFKVTEVNKNAFKNCKKIKSVSIGTNVTKIGANAFNGCSKLKYVVIRTKGLKSIGSNAFKGISSKAKFKVPKNKLSKYSKMIKKAKAPKTSKITK
ncbi:MAG: leucine-rich repeat protein [Eubacterium sp.]|nr:leucine-rich repeat protein [Eubacterium sp.]